MNANIAAVNKSQQTPQDLAERLSDVWELLHQEAEWRNLLEMQRPCRVSLVCHDTAASMCTASMCIPSAALKGQPCPTRDPLMYESLFMQHHPFALNLGS